MTNVCNQSLREVDRTPERSVAHVLMNPGESSLLHEHHRTDELYVVTHGAGNLVCGEVVWMMQPGDAIEIPRGTHHRLINAGIGRLEHLVLATPPFDPTDIVLDRGWLNIDAFVQPAVRPSVDDCFDGAKIVAYQFGEVVSVAFGWVMADPLRRKQAHYHRKTTEWIFITDGDGTIEIDGVPHVVGRGDWVRIDPNEGHALRTEGDQHMVVVCSCTPRFTMDDVHYR